MDPLRTPGRRFRRAAHAALAALLLAAAPAAAQQPAPGDTLTLEQALRLGLAASPSVREAEAARRTGSAARLESWGRLLPSLRLSAGMDNSGVLQRTGEDPVSGRIIQLPDSLVARQQRFRTDAGLYADWTVLDPAALPSIRMARLQAAAADLSLEGARARVAAEITLAYLDALEADAMLGLRRAEHERAAELRRIAEGRLAVGQVPELDVLQARLAEGDAELALMEAETAAETARHALRQHLDPGAEVPRGLHEPALPAPGALPGEDELRRRVLEESPGLRALQAERSAARAGRSLERMRLLPTVSVGAGWYRTELGQSRDALTVDPRNEGRRYWMNVSWGVLDRPGLRAAERQRSGAALQAADARVALRRAELVRALEVALGTVRRARLLQERATLNVALAARQREQAAERYRLGLAPIVERLQAEGLAREAERQALAARYAPLRALAELQRVSGTPLLPYSF